MSKFIQRDELIKMLTELSDAYDSEGRWCNDSLRCTGIYAKRDLCSDLAFKLSVPPETKDV